MYTFDFNSLVSAPDIPTIYTKGANPGVTSGDIVVPDRTGNPNRALATVSGALNTVYLFEKIGGTWTEIFKRESQIAGFGSDIDLSGNLLLIGVSQFRSTLGKFESWYFDPYISGYTANTDYRGWTKVTNTITDNYFGTVPSANFAARVSLYDNKVWAHAETTNVSSTYDIDYKGNLKLVRACTSNKAKIIETNDNCKILGIDESTKYRIKDIQRNIWLGCIYSSEAFNQEVATANPDVNASYPTFVDMLASTGPIEQIAQLDNAGLGFKSDSLNSSRYYNYDSDYYEELPENVIVYNKPPTDVSGDVEYTQAWYSEALSGLPRAILSGVSFSRMSEIPVDTVYYNLDRADMYVDEFPLQNYADYKYDVNCVIDDTTGAINNAVQLQGVRSYERVGTNGSIIWISYNLGTNYGNTEDLVTINSINASDDFTGSELNEYRWTFGGFDYGTYIVNNRLELTTIHNIEQNTIVELNNDEYIGDFSFSVDISNIDIITPTTGTALQSARLVVTAGTDTIRAGLVTNNTALDDGYFIEINGVEQFVSTASTSVTAIISRVGNTITITAGTLSDTLINTDNVEAVRLHTGSNFSIPDEYTSTTFFDNFDANDNVNGNNTGNPLKIATPIPEGEGTIINVEQITPLSGGIWDYQFIEQIKGVSRSSLGLEHKSNVYSIEVKNSQLNEAIQDESLRLLVQRIVERAIREFAKKVAPLHTQLWKVVWTGK